MAPVQWSNHNLKLESKLNYREKCCFFAPSFLQTLNLKNFEFLLLSLSVKRTWLEVASLCIRKRMQKLKHNVFGGREWVCHPTIFSFSCAESRFSTEIQVSDSASEPNIPEQYSMNNNVFPEYPVGTHQPYNNIQRI